MGWGVGRTGYWYIQLLKKFVGSVGMGSVKFETSAALWVASPSDAKILNVSNPMVRNECTMLRWASPQDCIIADLN